MGFFFFFFCLGNGMAGVCINRKGGRAVGGEGGGDGDHNLRTGL